ncbi:MAG: ABC transporter permease [Armatimonadetes bacterium]|nr:ABC transporter permease [Armatimonadota bacterium]
MLNDLRELVRYRELLITLVARDLKARYKRSVLGFFWSLLNPLVQIATLTVVFKMIMRYGPANFGPFLFVAFLPWTFFQLAVMDASTAVPSNVRILKRVYFPREVLPLANIGANLIHFLMAMVVLFAYLAFWVGVSFSWQQLLFLPLIVLLQTLLVTGLGLAVSCASVYYRDVHYLVTVGLSLLYWASCIFYPLYSYDQGGTVVKGLSDSPFWFVAWINPLVPLVTLYRQAILTNAAVPDGGMGVEGQLLARLAVFAVAMLVGGYALFNWRKWEFPELT